MLGGFGFKLALLSQLLEVFLEVEVLAVWVVAGKFGQDAQVFHDAVDGRIC